MGIGTVIKSCKGELLVACRSGKDHASSPKISKIYALKIAMLLCIETGLFSIIFEGDAKIVIEEINAREDKLDSL